MTDTLEDRRLPCPPEWSFELINEYEAAIAEVAAEYKLDTYPSQLEIITAEQMMEAYASIGMPINYRHWSFGKRFIATEQQYRRGQMGLAYEIVINSDPCIAYLMSENTTMMQALVIAHAAYGHNSFFKGNYLFRMWTNAESIIDYLVFARKYVADCEERYGIQAVEDILDSCHALMSHGVDRYKRPRKLSLATEQAQQRERETHQQAQINELWRTLPKPGKRKTTDSERRFPEQPEENLLYFIEKNAPLLEPWQREIIRIVRKVAQYFYPQRQTQVMNEGWATYWHHTLLNTLYDRGRLTDGFMMEFLSSHCNVVYQPPVTAPYYRGINPYALGFAMMKDIRRICEAPTDEDRAWFPDLAGSDWQKSLDFAMRNFKDDSFILQYLSPRLMREFRFFAIHDDAREKTLAVSAIHDPAGYSELRQKLARQYDISQIDPDIQIWSVDTRGGRSLTLRHFIAHGRPLDDGIGEIMKHVRRLWGFPVKLESVDSAGQVIKAFS